MCVRNGRKLAGWLPWKLCLYNRVLGSTVDIAGSAGPKKFAKKTTTAENYYEHRSGNVAVMVGRCDDVIIIGVSTLLALAMGGS